MGLFLTKYLIAVRTVDLVSELIQSDPDDETHRATVVRSGLGIVEYGLPNSLCVKAYDSYAFAAAGSCWEGWETRPSVPGFTDETPYYVNVSVYVQHQSLTSLWKFLPDIRFFQVIPIKPVTP